MSPAPLIELRGVDKVYGSGDTAVHAMRDVDAMMRLAELEMQRKDSAAALRLADWVAMRSAGQVAKAEAMRAAILRELGRPEASARAARRAAVKATERLPPFVLE